MWADPSLTIHDIAARLDITPSAVTQRVKARGLPPRKGGGGCNRKLDPALFRRMWDANVGAASIAEHFGVNTVTVTVRARQWGFPKRKCSRWNAISATAFLMRECAASEAAAARAHWEMAA